MTSSESVKALSALENEVARMIEQSISRIVLDTASALIDRHELRALDAVQLGCAIVSRMVLHAPDMQVIASDQALLHAAEREGFTVWSPSA